MVHLIPSRSPGTSHAGRTPVASAQDPAALGLLAVALARTGQYAEAAETCKLALDLARAGQQTRLVQPLESQLALFEAGKPYVE